MVTADFVVQSIDTNPFACLAREYLFELTAERIVTDDIELDDDVVFGRFHAGKHGGEGLAAVYEQRGIVVTRERHLSQLFERLVLWVRILVAHAEKMHFLFKRASDVVDLRVAGAAGLHVAGEFATA